MGQGYENHLVMQEADIHEAKGLYTNDIQRFYKVASSIVNVRQQDMDLSTYIGQIVSLKEEFLTVMPLTTDVGDQRTQIDKFFMVLTLIGLRLDLKTVCDQILGSSSVPSLDDVFACLLRISSTQTLPFDNTSYSSVLVSQTNSRGGRTGTEVEANVLIAPIAISLATLVIGVISYMGGLPVLPTWPSHLILSRLSLPVPPHLRVFPSLTVSMMTISTIRPPSQLLLLLLPRLAMLLLVLPTTSSLGPWILDSGALITYLDRSTGKTIGIGHESQGLYRLTSPSTPVVCISTDAPLLIHSRLGHPNLSKFQKMDKLSAKATKCIFLGYSRLQKGYRCYSSETYCYFLSADVTFFEDSPFFSTFESLLVSEVLPLPIISPPDAVPSRPLQVYHRHHRVTVPPSLAEVPADSLPIPLASLAPARPPSANLPIALRKVGCHWVYTVKVGPDGQIDCLKAYLVAKGYTQVYGSDYGDTFSPVAKIASVYLLLSMAAMRSWPLYQLDIKNAFLHGDLAKEVYMEQPPGFVAQGSLEFGMFRSTTIHSVFYHHNSSGQCIYLVVYVDDIVIIGNDQNGIQKLKQHLFTHFQTKDLGKLKYFLGIEIAQSSSGVVLSQRKYALNILEETGMLDCKPVDTPIDPNVKLIPGQGEPLGDPRRYRRLVGKLNYLIITRPDISFPISVVSQSLQSPCDSHLDVVIRILRYIKSTPGQGVLYENKGHT
ncbi:Retrovirus-related Pol polyprotein from transposon RE1 [Vitis vinifera]|uniref:Retrovirus-related Pol polyprotein from transposon RE1 n=1 Tax=Vitis vinifera TaxID=29760 RepID=A0A438I3Q8_VITVI|nr:Retrovirus-related Pol polyprotein from transposon RE1 [Vitis vinifera]